MALPTLEEIVKILQLRQDTNSTMSTSMQRSVATTATPDYASSSAATSTSVSPALTTTSEKSAAPPPASASTGPQATESKASIASSTSTVGAASSSGEAPRMTGAWAAAGVAAAGLAGLII
ncbi:hypothetical protein MMC09_000573 [Bachmanniomyces sp. S44760]|nr:hypothetical protein [Bachmanniomyces sp. S44760]